MFRSASSPQRQPVGALGYRAYVIGDVHGRLDLLKHLLAQIHSELDREPPGKCLLVFLGDLIDRGPNSAQVIERLRTYSRRSVEPVFLLGNHEEVLLRIVEGDAELISKWCLFGGAECLLSYGVNPDEVAKATDEEALAIVRAAIPSEHIKFLEGFSDSCRFGDYLFVHAGIRPGVELERQIQADLRWIREPFLNDKNDHGFVVVHGHTISSDVELRPNRIGIDTGAYRTDVLTALGIEGSDRWLLDTRPKSEPSN
ncbi:MAG TPA: metallophosphoesterase family protein [Sphingomicrobium sp.]|nr:metallophosphoesterase family protein [Sphingomicrobium sp.]